MANIEDISRFTLRKEGNTISFDILHNTVKITYWKGFKSEHEAFYDIEDARTTWKKRINEGYERVDY
jgi:hypothetical protein